MSSKQLTTSYLDPAWSSAVVYFVVSKHFIADLLDCIWLRLYKAVFIWISRSCLLPSKASLFARSRLKTVDFTDSFGHRRSIAPQNRRTFNGKYSSRKGKITKIEGCDRQAFVKSFLFNDDLSIAPEFLHGIQPIFSQMMPKSTNLNFLWPRKTRTF